MSTIIGLFVSVVGIGFVLAGGLLLLSTLFPTFGGSQNSQQEAGFRIFGAALAVVGFGLIFYGGTLV